MRNSWKAHLLGGSLCAVIGAGIGLLVPGTGRGALVGALIGWMVGEILGLAFVQ